MYKMIQDYFHTTTSSVMSECIPKVYDLSNTAPKGIGLFGSAFLVLPTPVSLNLFRCLYVQKIAYLYLRLSWSSEMGSTYGYTKSIDTSYELIVTRIFPEFVIKEHNYHFPHNSFHTDCHTRTTSLVISMPLINCQDWSKRLKSSLHAFSSIPPTLWKQIVAITLLHLYSARPYLRYSLLPLRFFQ